MTVELISVGTEILLGNIVNTNAAYMASRLASLGVELYHQVSIGDNEARLEDGIRIALSRSDIVILSGGLGPTKDDLTKEVVARVFNKELKLDSHTKKRIQAYFDAIGADQITDNNWKQAMIPEGALVIDNHNGTAPGLILKENGKTAILLPGPPNEIKPMFERDIAPYLNKLQPEGIYSKMVKICSVGESWAETVIEDLLESQNPTIAPYAKTGEVHFRVTAKASNEKEAEELMEPMLQELNKRFGNYIYTTDESVTLEDSVVKMLQEQQLSITTAESCTGGLLAGKLLNVAGASSCYQEGYITYSNEAKSRLLGVKEETLLQVGAVSKETAEEMAVGAATHAKVPVALSVTGIAGPDGGSKEKPVGLVYIGCFVKGKTYVKEFHFLGNREKIRDYAVVRALTMLREALL